MHISIFESKTLHFCFFFKPVKREIGISGRNMFITAVTMEAGQLQIFYVIQLVACHICGDWIPSVPAADPEFVKREGQSQRSVQQLPQCRANPEKVAEGGGGGWEGRDSRHIFSYLSILLGVDGAFTLWHRGTVRLHDQPLWWKAKSIKNKTQKGAADSAPPPTDPSLCGVSHSANQTSYFYALKKKSEVSVNLVLTNCFERPSYTLVVKIV